MGAPVTIFGWRDPGKDDQRSDRVMGEYVLDRDAPVGGILSRIRLGAVDGRFVGLEGFRGPRYAGEK